MTFLAVMGKPVAARLVLGPIFPARCSASRGWSRPHTPVAVPGVALKARPDAGARDDAPKAGCLLRPELVEPEVQPVEALSVDGIDAPCALRRHSHQIAVQKGLQMLRNGRTADRQAIGQFVDGSGRATQFLQQMSPVRVCYGCKRVKSRHVVTLWQRERCGKWIVCGNGGYVLYFKLVFYKRLYFAIGILFG